MHLKISHGQIENAERNEDVPIYMYIYNQNARLYLTLWNSVDCSPPGYSALLIFPRQEYWSGLPFPSPWESQEDPWLSGWTHVSCVSCTGSRFFTTEPPGKPNYRYSLTYAIKWEKKIYLLNSNVILSNVILSN